MRDFRDAKAMAHTLRASLAAKGFKITISQSLELIADAFGVANWNRLAATIRRESFAPRKTLAPLPQSVTPPPFSVELESTLHRALAYANQRKHQYATLEHLLLALIDDADASAVMKACGVDLGALKENLVRYIDDALKRLVIDDGRESEPTPAFQRVVQRAALRMREVPRQGLTGAELLVALFAETQSPAARSLDEQNMTRQDALNFIVHGIAKGSGEAAV